jgi:hypothetical protein
VALYADYTEAERLDMLTTLMLRYVMRFGRYFSVFVSKTLVANIVKIYSLKSSQPLVTLMKSKVY